MLTQKFTGQERDSESGLDNFKARYASAPQGRFQSPDPLGMFVADPANPQSWNLYSYVMNNPLRYVDPTGTNCVYAGADNGTIVDYLDSTNYVDDNQGGQTCAEATAPGNNNTPSVTVYGNYDDIAVWFAGGGTGASMEAAPNIAIPWYKTCTAQALLSGAGSIAIDSIGLIPEAEGFTKVFENEAGYQIAKAVGNSAGYRGVVATQYGMKVVTQGKGAVGAISGAFGLGDTSVQGRISTGLTVAGFIPGIGTLAAGASIVNDAIKTGMAVAKCP